MKPLLIHVPHASRYIPRDYMKTALIPIEEVEEENRFMCDTGVVEFIPMTFREDTLIFPYSRLYCDVERFRDESEAMAKYGMGFVYTHDSKGREIFRPTKEHIKEVEAIYDQHHAEFNWRVESILEECGHCLVVDLHSFSDEVVERMFGITDAPDVCIGTDENTHNEDIVQGIESICCGLGLSTRRNYPYSGTFVPNAYYGKPGTGITSVMIEINKRVLEKNK